MGNYEIWKKISRINELKSYLRESDYQAIKYAEGELTAEEYAEMKATRKAWRDEINELEKQMKEINYGT